jgi:hypothetical protein
MTPKHHQGEERVERVLRSLGLEYERNQSIAGLQPDFVVRGPKGKQAVIEVKTWEPEGNTARAANQVKKYREVTASDFAAVVLPDLKRNLLSDGVVNEVGLQQLLQEWLSLQWVRYKRVGKRVKKVSPRDRIVFAAMPFDRKYDDTFLVAMSYAAKKINAACRRVDKTEFSGDIVEEIKRLIKASVAVIADLSESKPNVLYEAGFAHALGKPTVHICSTNLEQLPFDVRNWNAIQYEIGGTSALQGKLARRLRSVMPR